MMKRILPLIAALALLLIGLPALAETDVPEALYRIVLRTETGDVTLGTGVLFGNGATLLTPRSCWTEGELLAIGAEGEHAITSRREVLGSHLLILTIKPYSTATPLIVTQGEALDSFSLYGATAAGELVALPLEQVRYTLVDESIGALLHTDEGLLPGAVMLGDDGELAVITLWQQAEGEGAYTAVTDTELHQYFPPEMNAFGVPAVLHNITAVYHGGQVTVDWSKATGYVSTENTIYTPYISAEANPYMSSDVVTDGGMSITFPAIPGMEMVCWVMASEQTGAEPLGPERASQLASVIAPDDEDFTLHDFQNLRCGLTLAQPGLEGMAEDFLPQVALSRDSLMDESLTPYFQTEDRYSAPAYDDAHTLMVTLYTPEGYAFYYHSGYAFMPEMKESDLWVAYVSVIFDEYVRFCGGEPWPAGDYRVLYTIDGGRVAEFGFNLK